MQSHESVSFKLCLVSEDKRTVNETIEISPNLKLVELNLGQRGMFVMHRCAPFAKLDFWIVLPEPGFYTQFRLVIHSMFNGRTLRKSAESVAQYSATLVMSA